MTMRASVCLSRCRASSQSQRLSTSWASGSSSSSSFSSCLSSSEPSATKSKRSYNSLNQETAFQLCFVRHGQSTWNRENRFIGWSDTPLTDTGVLEARVAGQMLRQAGLLFDECHTSLLRRSIRTANLCLMELGQEYIPVHKSYRLNERHYGDLVGRNKKEAVVAHGKDQVKRWRRSYDEAPPDMKLDHPHQPAMDPRYRLMLDKIPKAESLKDTVARSSVYWDNVLAPRLQQGKTLLIVGHENNLRSLIMRLEGISPEDIIHLSLPRAVPLAYRLDENLKPLPRQDGRLDEATGFLRGEWLGGDKAVKEILERDYQNVYDTKVTKNLETCESQNNWQTWMESVMGKPTPYQAAKGETAIKHDSQSASQSGFLGSSPISGVDVDNFDACQHGKGIKRAA